MKLFFEPSIMVDMDSISQKLELYTKHLKTVCKSHDYANNESSLQLPFDTELFKEIENVISEKVTEELLLHVIIGIGGSNLGTKAVYDGLYGYRETLGGSHFPRLIFAETVSSLWLDEFSTIIQRLDKKEQFLVSIISKSGSTTETLTNFEVIYGILKQQFDDQISSRIVVISDAATLLQQMSLKYNFTTLTIPKLIGGRFSVLSAVGLYPLLSVGTDINLLRRGASEFLENFVDSSNSENMALFSAATLWSFAKHGRNINDNFYFAPELESLGKWSRQLMAESIGKMEDDSGNIVNSGITPTVSIGSTDLHSVAQLYIGGPKDKFTTFINVLKEHKLVIPADRLFPEIAPMINGKSVDTIMDAIFKAVKKVYSDAKLPFMEIELESVNEYEIGAFMQFKMLEIMYLGKLFSVNAFDQPNVESYKIETKQILDE